MRSNQYACKIVRMTVLIITMSSIMLAQTGLGWGQSTSKANQTLIRKSASQTVSLPTVRIIRARRAATVPEAESNWCNSLIWRVR